ncbi:hexokinase [Batrachochytrium dendrobatidis]|nr:hexokinase [Batrachochytrium dendrobatidis]
MSQLYIGGLLSGIVLSVAVQMIVQSQLLSFRRSRPSKNQVPAKTMLRHLSVNDNFKAFMESGGNLKGYASSAAGTDALFSQICAELTLSTQSLSMIVAAMVKSFKAGLAEDGQGLPMIPSHVVNRPNGTETGTVLALDLGGSNFRVCLVTMNGNGGTRMVQRKYVISHDLKNHTGLALFDFIAKCVAEFLDEQKDHLKLEGLEVKRESSGLSKSIKLGFTFSFPVKQTALDQGDLMYWNKGFSATGVVGVDVVKLLQNALDRNQINAHVTALVNDTVGTLISHAYTRPETHIGVIFGTGTNAAYVEKISEIGKWGGFNEGSDEMIVNTEWGAFNDADMPRSKYDILVDKNTSNHGIQIFEKMISGLYLGEIVRYILVDFVTDGELFDGKLSKKLATPYAFETAFMSRIERDHSADLLDVKQLLSDLLDINNTTSRDRMLIKHVCEIVGTRAARLSAAGIAAIVTKTNRLNGCIVAIDGSLFGQYPHFGSRMRDALREILGLNAENIILEQAHDGSGLGAALIAVTSSRD